MYLIFDRITKQLISFNDILIYETNTKHTKFVYLNEYIVIGNYPEVDYIELHFNEESQLDELIPGQYQIYNYEINEILLENYKYETLEKGNIIINLKINELSKDKNIGYLTEKCRLARSVIKGTGNTAVNIDFQTEADIRGLGETNIDLAKKVKRKCEIMMRNLIRVNIYYDKLIKDMNNADMIGVCDMVLAEFKNKLNEYMQI